MYASENNGVKWRGWKPHASPAALLSPAGQGNGQHNPFMASSLRL